MINPHISRQFKKIRIIRKLYYGSKHLLNEVRHKILSYKAYNNYKNSSNNKKNTSDNKIRVVFICQHVQSWDRFSFVYRIMKDSHLFYPYILCVPGEIERNGWLVPNVSQNDVYDYFKSKGYENIINSVTIDKKWFDLLTINPDYIFYSRPYSDYLPAQYRPSFLGKNSTICLILYGTIFMTQTVDVMENYDFFSYVNIFFSEHQDISNITLKRFRLEKWLGCQKVFTVGFPNSDALEDCKNLLIRESKMDGKPTILWTPRWSTDPVIGGSNFFNYKNELISYAESHQNINLMIRPHPGMLKNFLFTGEMSQEEVDDFLFIFDNQKNILFDSDPNYCKQLWQSSILVSDFSSLMLDFLYTGKPIIYCYSSDNFHFLDYMKKVIDASYVVNNTKELIQTINELLQGKDPKKHIRLKIQEELYAKNNVSKQIVKEIISDFMNR